MDKEKVSEIISKFKIAVGDLFQQMKYTHSTAESREIAPAAIEGACSYICIQINSYGGIIRRDMPELNETPEFKTAIELYQKFPDHDATAEKIWYKNVTEALTIVAEKYGKGLKKAA